MVEGGLALIPLCNPLKKRHLIGQVQAAAGYKAGSGLTSSSAMLDVIQYQ